MGEQILEVALGQFILLGAEGANMDDIAAAANVSKRTIYARYGSKLGLLIAAMKYGIDDRLRPIAATMRSGRPRERLLRTARKMLDLSLKPETIGFEKLALWIREQNIDDINVQALLDTRPVIALTRELLEELIDPEDAKSLDLHFLAMFVFDALVTAPRHRILFRKDLLGTPEAKTAYLVQAIDLLGALLPSLRETAG